MGGRVQALGRGYSWEGGAGAPGGWCRRWEGGSGVRREGAGAGKVG